MEKTDFQYAYIDKGGNIKFTLGNRDQKVYYTPLGGDGRSKQYVTNSYGSLATSLVRSGYFINGYTFWLHDGKNALIDTLGRVIPLREFLSQSVSTTDKNEVHLHKYDEKGIYFKHIKFGRSRNDLGIVDYNRNILFPPFFDGITPDYYSPFALAKYHIPTQKPQYGMMLEGVINKDGKFILIREKKDIF